MDRTQVMRTVIPVNLEPLLHRFPKQHLTPSFPQTRDPAGTRKSRKYTSIEVQALPNTNVPSIIIFPVCERAKDKYYVSDKEDEKKDINTKSKKEKGKKGRNFEKKKKEKERNKETQKPRNKEKVK